MNIQANSSSCSADDIFFSKRCLAFEVKVRNLSNKLLNPKSIVPMRTKLLFYFVPSKLNMSISYSAINNFCNKYSDLEKSVKFQSLWQVRSRVCLHET